MNAPGQKVSEGIRLCLEKLHLLLIQAQHDTVTGVVRCLAGAMCFIHQQDLITNPHRITDQMPQELEVFDSP